MRSILIAFTIFTSTFQLAFALNLSDYEPFEYRVYFTNPICRLYAYDQPVLSNDGIVLKAKPKNTYCKQNDFVHNFRRRSSPHYQLIQLIGDKKLKEISLAYLSFSNKYVANALCSAVEKRNVKVSFIMDSNNRERENAREMLDRVSKCRPDLTILAEGEKPNVPATYFRGNTRGLGFAHNKIIIAKFKNSNKVKIVFSSGNMSSGTILHHENWHFVTTNSESYFAKAHECVYKGMLTHASSIAAYTSFIKQCRGSINAEPEKDIQFFIVPSDGQIAMNKIVENIAKAKTVDVAVHRYSHPELRLALEQASPNKTVRIVADDDIYWTGRLGHTVGSNNLREYGYMTDLFKAGGKIYYMETNQNAYLLHHNKYIVFHFEEGQGAVFAGAGNFSKSAFTKNFENFYYITIPKVYDAFKRQYEHVVYDLASDWSMLPREYVNP